jgi:hypothetical protein
VRPAACLAACALLAVLVPGCAAPGGGAVAVAPVVPMAAAARGRDLPAGFPAEVPVPEGRVTEASRNEDSRGQGIWLYTVVVAAPPAAVEGWYDMAYRGANWERTAGAPPGASGAQAEYAKGEAQSLLRFAPIGSGSTRVQATVSIGAPIAPVQ